MAQSRTQLSRGALLTLEIWRPNCWALEVTDTVPASLLAHTVYNSADSHGNEASEGAQGHFTAYGDSSTEIDRLVEEATDSQLTHSLVEMERRYDRKRPGFSLGNTSRELFVEYESEESVTEALISQGFVQEAPVQIRDGTEYWSVFVDDEDRERLKERLDRVRALGDIEVEVTRIASGTGTGDDVYRRVALLTERQREIFELACEYNYYTWPREITTRELADKAGITKTTLLEHLRTAESKLLTPVAEEGDSL